MSCACRARRWVPKASSPLAFMRHVRQRHMLHHLKSHDHWFAFSLPAMDDWLGTAPSDPSRVPLKTLARAGGKAHHL